ncbi:uncharacterized protein LOC135120397 [Zophobas morio]|uniref:uncharacterized protein LOC135120397 n=1 Tax=Zophobas morio TaxID=2755281 RepID=UPI003082C17E
MKIYGKDPLNDQLITVKCNLCQTVVKDSAFLEHMEILHPFELNRFERSNQNHNEKEESEKNVTMRATKIFNNLGEQYAFCSLGQSCNHSNSGTYEGTRKIILSEGVIEEVIEDSEKQLGCPTAFSKTGSARSDKELASIPREKKAGIEKKNGHFSGESKNSAGSIAKRSNNNNYFRRRNLDLSLDARCGVEVIRPLQSHEGDSETAVFTCRRSLTCKIHSITAKRRVVGRSKSFDELYEHYTGKPLRSQKKGSRKPENVHLTNTNKPMPLAVQRFPFQKVGNALTFNADQEATRNMCLSYVLHEIMKNI